MDVSTFVLAGWNVLITLVFGLTVVVYRQSMDKVKDQGAEIHRLGILLNRTREEVARDNVTNDEVEKITQIGRAHV